MRHTMILVRAEVRAPLLTIERADEFLRLAVAAAGMNVIDGPHSIIGVIPDNEGVTSVAVLDYSSVTLHEWPAHEPHPLIQFCLYTCGAVPVIKKFRKLFEQLDLAKFHATVFDIDDLLMADLPHPFLAWSR